MKQTLFELAAFVALPLFVVIRTEIDDVVAGNVGGPSGRREHLALHRGLDFARDLHQKLFPNAARLRVLVGGFKQVFARLAVDPFSYRLKESQSLLLLKEVNQISRTAC